MQSLRQDPAAVISHHAVSGNTAWQIDKWKFLPLHADAYRRWPNAKWHIAIEDDTWLLWNNLVKWLKTKPHDEQKFYGNQMWLVVSAGDCWVAEGERGAMEQVELTSSDLAPSRTAASLSTMEVAATLSPGP